MPYPRTVITFLIANIIVPNLATICYKCKSINGDCGDPYEGNKNHEINCARSPELANNDGCDKYKTRGKLLGYTVTAVNRDCGKLSSSSKSLCANGLLDNDGIGQVWTCSCDGDRCNSAHNHYVNLLMPTVVAIAAFLYCEE